jgi:hypothetical protein
MNRLEHLLATLGEEAAEIVQEAHKCQRFGIHNHFEGRPNGDYLLTEVVQLLTVLEMVLEEAGFIPDETFDEDKVADEKRQKVEKFMHLAETIWGTVEPGSSRYWKQTAEVDVPVEDEEWDDEEDTEPDSSESGEHADSAGEVSGAEGPSSQ